MKVFSFNDWLSSGGTLSTASYSSDSYNRISWVYAAVNRIALTASSAPLIFFQGNPELLPTYDPKERIYDRNHPVLKLFNPPKYPIILSLRDLLYRTFIHLGIDGKLFWVIEYKKGFPVTIDIKSKDALTPIYKDRNQDTIVGWQESRNSKRWRLEDVLMIQEYRPSLENGVSLDGLSPLSAARLSLDSEYQINGWNASYFRTGMKTPLLLQSRGMLTKDQKSDIRKEIINYYSGIDGAHGALILQGGIDVTPLQVGSKDIDFIMGKKLNREEILGVYGVPPSLVGLFEYASYANAREQTQIFWEQTLLPKMSAILDLIQVNILDLAFPGIYAMWDTTKVAGLKPDPVALAVPAKTYVDMGYHPIQVAKILNFPDLVPDKNFDKLRIQRQEQQLQYQQELMQLHSDNQNQNQDQPQESKPPKKGQRDLNSVITVLSAKLRFYAEELKNGSYEDRDDLWDVCVRCYVHMILAEVGCPTESVMFTFDAFKNSDPDSLSAHADEIAKIFVVGVYNPASRR